jgi:hypothetical protein
MEKISEKIKSYKESLDKISQKRKVWADSVKEIIYDTLLKVKKSTDLDWQVQKV